jgi:P27 family predicted phage terminase small subunit
LLEIYSFRMVKKVINSSICPEAQTFLDNLTALLRKQKILTSLDEDTLVLIGNCYHNYIEATKILLQDGLLDSSKKKAHPCIKIQLDAQIQLNKMMWEYGMSPKSRKEISKPIEKAKEESDMAKFLKKTKVNVKVQNN